MFVCRCISSLVLSGWHWTQCLCKHSSELSSVLLLLSLSNVFHFHSVPGIKKLTSQCTQSHLDLLLDRFI